MATLATLIGTSSFLQDTRTCLNASLSSNFDQTPQLTTELFAKSTYNLFTTPAPSFLCGSFFFILAGNKNMLKAWMSLYFSQI